MEFKILEKIKSPEDIKNMSFSELNSLASEIREALILNISNTGGHLASNLGVVELTLAIHKVFDSPSDQIVFDVGHQCYIHKMLTGRYSEFSILRKKGGLSGFPSFEESEHDFFKTGHSSTSISSALGLAYSNYINGNDSTAVAVIGDGSMTGGLAYEGLNNAGSSGKNLVVILNDNDMSISKNVGAISKLLTKLRNKSGYFTSKDIFSGIVSSIPCIGKPLYRWLFKLKTAVKFYFYSSNIFENMGFKYFGPIDGHNIELLVRVLSRAKSLKCPVFVHVNTKKGKGYTFAENKPNEYHGVGEFDIDTGESNKTEKLTFTDVFGRTLTELAEKNDKVCAITAAMGQSCGLGVFSARYPDRYFDVGIAEQHAVTFAGGLAKNGFIPVVAIYSTFLQRSFDQIIHDVSLQKLKVIFAIDRAGIVGNDGETHQGLFDIPMLLSVPDIKIFSPSNGTELECALKRAVNDEKESVAIRYPKANSVSYGDYPFNGFENWEFIDNLSGGVIVTYGLTVHDVLKASTGFRVNILKLNLINKFDDALIDKLCSHSKILFVEECYSAGGIGMFLAYELAKKNFNGSFSAVSIKNEFIKHAEQTETRQSLALDPESLKNKIAEIFSYEN